MQQQYQSTEQYPQQMHRPSAAYTQQQHPYSSELVLPSGSYPTQVNVSVQFAPGQEQQSNFPHQPQNPAPQFHSTSQWQQPTSDYLSAQPSHSQPQFPLTLPYQQSYEHQPIQPTSYHFGTTAIGGPSSSYGTQFQTGYGVQPAGPASVSATAASGSGQRSRINYYRKVIPKLKTKQNSL